MILRYLTNKNVNTSGLATKPIMIFGAGDYGYFVGDFLEKYGFEEFAYCVDDRYYQEGMLFHDKPVYRIHDVSFHDVNLVFSVGSPKRLKSFMENSPCKEAYIIFDPYEFWNYDDFYMELHQKEVEQSLSFYADDLSRETLRGYLLAKRTGDISEDLKNISMEKMYFNSLTQNVPHGYYVDCGAFDGENIDDYLLFIHNPHAEVMAFEPVEENYEKLKQKYRAQKNIVIHQIGLWDSERELYIKHEGYKAREAVLLETAEESNQTTDMLSATTLDKMIGDRKTAFIKIMTEGNEFRVLRGAERTIKRDRPIVAAVPFCDIASIYQMPMYLHSFGFYRLYLRHYECVSGRLVLYAIPVAHKNE